MISSEPPPGEVRKAATANAEAAAPNRWRKLKLSFCWAVLWLAVFQFSEDTADPDLWGHVICGQEMLRTHQFPKTEIYSWTARGRPFIDHEWLSEVCLGGAHGLAGGSGLLLLKVLMGLATLGLGLRLGVAWMAWPERAVAWSMAALAVVEISFGFAPRPQIFTALFLALELWLLRRIHEGGRAWTMAMPLLFLVWINLHGGVLAGFGLLGLSAGVATAQWLYAKMRKPAAGGGREASRLTRPSAPDFPAVVCLWVAVAASAPAMLVNPWGAELLRWLVGSVLWLRPEIQEWNPTPFGWDHAAFFILVAVAVFAWACSRRPRVWWELAACVAFAVLGWRSVRNAPLCAIVILALVPPHLADALERFRAQVARLEALGREAGFQKFATVFLVGAGIASGVATFTLHKDHAFTIEVPAAQYPVGALAFLREHALRGKMLVYFDWGEMVIFHLPDCPPSIDGRLDTCYSRELIDAHWKFFRGEPVDPRVLDLDAADLALLPSSISGGPALAQRPGWKVIYYDATAMLLARNPDRFPALAHLALPVAGPPSASRGRAAFAARSERWK
jgi:hypothetical protein